MTIRPTIVLSAALTAALGAAMFAQSAPSAAAALSGTWSLDTYLSDRPEQIAAAIRINLGFGRELEAPPPGGAPPEGMRGGDPRARRGRGPQPRGDAPSAEEQNKLEEQLSPLRYPSTTLKVDASSDRAAATDDQGQTRTLRWDGPQLAFDQDLGKGRRVLYTYSIVPTTRQLLVRVRFDRGPGMSSPFEIRYVYNRSSNP